MNLYLMRHGSAMRDGTVEPVLTEKGVAEVEKIARYLAGIATPAEIRHSTRERARQTGRILGEAFGLEPVAKDGMTPNSPVGEIAEELVFEPDDVLIVSHLPFIERLAARLLDTGGRSDPFVLPTGAVLCLERSEFRSGDARWWVRWLVTPKIVS